MKRVTPQRDRRPKLYARIHILVKELGLDDHQYRDCLHDAFGVRSSKTLNEAELIQFADGLASLLPAKHPQRNYPGTPRNLRKPPPEGESSRNAQLRKIEALLAEAGYPWRYADVLAQRVCKVERVAWVEEDELYKVITALELDAKRKGRQRG